MQKFSDLFKEDSGGDIAPSNVSSDVATNPQPSKPKKRKELEESEGE